MTHDGNTSHVLHCRPEWEFSGRDRTLVLCVATGLELRPEGDSFDSARLDELINEATQLMRASASPIDRLRIVPSSVPLQAERYRP